MSLSKLTIKDVPLEHKTVLVRADYNVPLNSKGEISDDLRIRASLPTLRYLISQHCKVVIMSHLGRPDGVDPSLSLAPVAKRLEELLGSPVGFLNNTIGDVVKHGVRKAGPNSVTLLENLRFYSAEEDNLESFAKQIAVATGARYFVQDGFGVIHRAHASTEAITHFIPSVAGLLLEKEFNTITAAMENPQRPLVAVLGGAKVSDKITVIERFVQVADKIIIGGAMANTFLTYRGYTVGASKIEDGQGEVLNRIYAAAAEKVGSHRVDEFIVLPTDVAVATSIDTDAERRLSLVSEIANDYIALDIGDQSITHMVKEILPAKTVVWNGTLGYAEIPAFAHGSARLALSLATQQDTTSIIGGGDTADFVLKWDSKNGESFTHVSTGGGASLELMAGETLPGIDCLLDARS